MPPKRKAATRAVPNAGKQVCLTGNSEIDDTPLTAASGRPKRESIHEPVHTFTTSQISAENPKKLAKSSKAGTASDSAPKSRTRPTRSEEPSSNTKSSKPTRGRTDSANITKLANKRKRAESPIPASKPKKRGRISKSENGAAQALKDTSIKSAPKTQVSVKVPRLISVKSIGGIQNEAGKDNGPSPVLNGADIVSTNSADYNSNTSDDPDETDNELDPQDTQYWLMKAEPDTRMEKGIDVAFPIDKLAAATEPEPWDGVRNPVARNHMRAMRKNDLAFFYHSNTSVPGIVGVMRIVEEHAIDESAFDPTHPYFDPKSSRDKPKWECVKVEFVKKFNDIITLKELKSTPELADMQIAQKAYGRLSVQMVKPSEWKFLLERANEPADLGMVEVNQKDGYEAETDGETEKLNEDEKVGISDAEVSKQNVEAVNGVEDKQAKVKDVSKAGKMKIAKS